MKIIMKLMILISQKWVRLYLCLKIFGMKDAQLQKGRNISLELILCSKEKIKIMRIWRINRKLKNILNWQRNMKWKNKE